MIERHQRCTLAARLHIGAAKIIHHIDAGEACQQGAIADLPSPAPGRAVQDGLAMKADQIDIRLARFADQFAHSLRMGERDMPLRIADGVRDGGTFGDVACLLQRGVEHDTGLHVIGHRQGRAPAHHSFPIGDEQRCVDTIKRGAAHQTNGFNGFRHVC